MTRLARSRLTFIGLSASLTSTAFVGCAFDSSGTIPTTTAASSSGMAGAGGSGGDGGSGGTISTGGMGGEGGGKVCVPGEQQTCYSGPANTANIGTCKFGNHVCLADGTDFGPCMGEVLPETIENCVLPEDQDCDGLADIDDPECVCTMAGASVDCDTGKSGICAPGKGLCASDGRSIEACVQVALPSAENCDTLEDDDCDGTAAPMCSGDPKWSYLPPSGNGNTKDDAIFSVATTPDGGYVVVGVVDGTISGDGFGVTVGTGYIAKLGADKTVMWEKRFTSTGFAVARGVAVEKNGNIIVGGSYSGTANIDGVDAASNGVDGFIVKYDAGGARLASRLISTMGTQDIIGVAVDTAGNYCGIGTTSADINFGGGNMQTATGTDFYITCSKPDNMSLWSRIIESGGNQYGRGITMTSGGDVIIIGNADNTNTNLGNGDIAKGNNFDFFVARYANADGAYVWGNLYGKTNDQRCNGISMGTDGNVLIAGEFSGTIDWKNGKSIAATAAPDVFVAKLDATTGVQIQDKKGGTTGTVTGTSVASDAAGNVTLFGHFNGTIDFGNAAGPTSSFTGANDTFLVKLRGSDWSHVWTKPYGKNGHQYGWGVAVNSDGTAITGGEFYTELEVPPGGIMMTTGGADLFAVLSSP